MSSIRDFKKVAGLTAEVANLQERLQEFFQPIVSCPLLDGVLVTNVALNTTPTKVEHKLRRAPLGYIIVRQNANSVVYESSKDLPTSFITLTASAAVTVDLWVF